MNSKRLDEFLEVMDRLLSENGCPWDKQQTHQSLRQYMIEECYEVVDAIDRDDMPGLCEELGDVLLEVVFHCKIAEKEDTFTIADVINGIKEKMIRRHPHIFTEHVKAHTAEQVLDNWDKIKKVEKEYSGPADELRAVPKPLPALIRAEKVLKRGYKYQEAPEIDQILSEMRRILDTLAEKAGSAQKDDLFNEYGRFLLSAVKLAGKIELNAEFALTNAIETFINRFEYRE